MYQARAFAVTTHGRRFATSSWFGAIALGAIVLPAFWHPAIAVARGSGVRRASTRLEFRSDPARMRVGVPAQWTLRVIRAADGRPETRFEPAHERLMHLIVVSRDLAWFNHLHPTYKGAGVFVVTATLPRAGGYRLFADYTQTGGQQSVLQHDVVLGGGGTAAAAALHPDSPDAQGWLHRSVGAIQEGRPDLVVGRDYRVSLMPMPASPGPGEAVRLHFRVEDATGRPIHDLQPYLGALGHAVVLSADGTTYLHAHPMSAAADAHGEHASMPGMQSMSAPSSGPDVVFHTAFPRAGSYKVWGQFRHRDAMIVAPFVVHVPARQARER